MVIAEKLKNKNRAEYLLYMWQVEDIIRAFGADEERIKKEYLSQFSFDAQTRQRVEDWYEGLCHMMHSEGKVNGGHLQICRNILQELAELHSSLLSSNKFPYYREMYYKVLPYIVELRHKNNADSSSKERLGAISELESVFEVLYGVMLLRLQKKEITEETAVAVKNISAFLGQLSDYYMKDKQEPIDF